MSLEYLGEEPSRRLHWVLPVIVALVVVVAALGWWSESVRATAAETLASDVSQVQSDAEAGQAKVLSTLTYAYPLIWSSQVSEKVRSSLRKVVEGSAADVVTDLAQLRDRVANTRVMPWQGDQLKDRASVLSLVDAYLARFRRIAGDARQIGAVMAQSPPAAPDLARASGDESTSDR